ncbi:hypothetical protein [Parasitella parasitica]|uniref:ATP-dependent DNA helicase n=1 Tax=Parasitella parasitica TaxID=35722 RepID=A0A0B7NWC3_9FUNG|nr:hypothetical protein [Parasitella parasitica]
MMCSITPKSAIATLLKQSKLIIWDEASMTSRHIFEAVHRTFRDIARHVEPEFAKIFFGGRLMVFGGDFRQIFPVIPRGSRSDVVDQCINMSALWSSVTCLKLRVNMRIQQALVANDPVQAQELQEFADKLLEIGEGRAETLSVPSISGLTNSDFIKIPNYMSVPGNNLFDLLKELYPSIFTTTPLTDPNLLTSSAIWTTKNIDVTTINNLMLDAVPGEATTYYSADKAQDAEPQIEVPPEFLNSIDTGSLPPHTVNLKVGVPIMLLRNINPKNGLCNGTRLIVRSLLTNVIEASIATGSHIGNITYIPRIKIHVTEDDPTVSIPFERCQFPIRLAFGMTINKAQGQTMARVGMYLPTNVFSHGQLYVAMSRVKDRKAIKILIDKNCTSKIPNNIPENNSYTRNVVFTEVFQ